MTLYVISYDVRVANHDYQPLYDQLNGWKAAHLQNSVWLASIDGTASQIRDILKAHMHANDTIAVIQLAAKPDWATQAVRPTGLQWLKTYNP